MKLKTFKRIGVLAVCVLATLPYGSADLSGNRAAHRK